jgi:hypothetical protein
MPALPSGAPVEVPNALPPGTRLGEFEIRRVLGVGGFGIVYLAFDHALEREVAVKEYMPASLAGRSGAHEVSLRSGADADSFALGLRSFVNEARLLARFDHPSLLKVHRFWEANGTAYMAMPVLRGRTLREVREAMPRPPDEPWLRSMLDPLLGAIERLHSEDVFHRDIAPDNIVVEEGGRPVLLDFGAARRVLGDRSQALTAILKPAYAPIEQYAESTGVKQGAWTDLYALGATLHYLLLAHPPLPATTRAVHDEQPALASMALPGCSPRFLRIVDWMLAPRPADRPQSVAQLRAVLQGQAEPPSGPVAWAPTVPIGAGASEAPTIVVARAGAVASAAPATVPRSAPAPARVDAPAPAAVAVRPTRSNAALGVAIGFTAAVIAIGALWWLGRPAPPAAPMPVAASAPAGSGTSTTPLPAPADPASAQAIAGTPDVVAPAATAPTATSPAPVATPRPPARPPVDRRAAVPAPETPSPTPAPAAPAPPVAASPAPPAAPASGFAPAPALRPPSQTCEGRWAIALWRCYDRECRLPGLRDHPECVAWRAQQNPQDRPP